jgi:hypothetical protein
MTHYVFAYLADLVTPEYQKSALAARVASGRAHRYHNRIRTVAHTPVHSDVEENFGMPMDIDDADIDVMNAPALDDGDMALANGSTLWLRSMVMHNRTFTAPVGDCSLVMADFNVDNMTCASTPILVSCASPCERCQLCSLSLNAVGKLLHHVRISTRRSVSHGCPLPHIVLSPYDD